MPARLTKATFWTTYAALGVLAVWVLVLAMGWINRPFPGFLVLKNGAVDSLSSARWTGFQHGIKQRDFVVAVNGASVANGSDVYRQVAALPVGSEVTYTLDRPVGLAGKLERVRLQVPSQRFDWFDFVGFFLTFWVVGVIHYLIGLVVSVVKPGDRVARSHLYFCLAFGTFVLTAFDGVSTHLFTHFPHNQAFSTAGFFALLLALMIPRTFAAIDSRPWIYRAIIGVAVGFYGFVAWSFYQPLVWPATFLALLGIGSMALMCLPISSVVALINPTSTEQIRSQAKLLAWSALIGDLPTIVYNGLAAVGHTIPYGEMSYFLLIIFPTAVAYTIVRHQLFGIEVIVKRTLVYAMVTSALVPVYFVITGGARWLVGGLYRAPYLEHFLEGPHAGTALNLVATAVISVLFAPLRDRAKAFVDRYFFRTGYDFKQIVTEFADRTRETLDAGEVLRAFTRQVDTALVPSYMAVYLKDGGQLALKETHGDSVPDGLPRELVAERLVPRATQDLRADPGNGPAGGTQELVLPLSLKDEHLGAVVMGPRKSDLPYKAEDLDLVNNLSQQLTLWVKNAQLFAQVFEQERMKRELEIAAEVQMGILPRKLPDLPGVLLAGISQPALEVGGDLYDVIKLDDDRIGILVGDVTGKGVPAALLMAITMSIFRTLAPDCETATETMARANQMVYKNRPSSKMFVACFYAIYDRRTRQLRCANAGNPFPMASFGRVEVKGLALGVMPGTSYDETVIDLAEGDTVVFYSDGLEDAINPAGEQFGEEGLEPVYRQVAHLDPAEIQVALFEAIARFSGEAKQFDDLTMVALKVTPAAA